MSELEYCLEQLKELIKIAKKANEPMLVYLLELAIAEAFDEINRRRNASRLT